MCADFLQVKLATEREKYDKLLQKREARQETKLLQKKKFDEETSLIDQELEKRNEVVRMLRSPLLQEICSYLQNYDLAQICVDYLGDSFCEKCNFIYSEDNCPFRILHEYRHDTIVYSSSTTWLRNVIDEEGDAIYVPTEENLKDLPLFLHGNNYLVNRCIRFARVGRKVIFLPDQDNARNLYNYFGDKPLRFTFTFECWYGEVRTFLLSASTTDGKRALGTFSIRP